MFVSMTIRTLLQLRACRFHLGDDLFHQHRGDARHSYLIGHRQQSNRCVLAWQSDRYGVTEQAGGLAMAPAVLRGRRPLPGGAKGKA
jgi:hypothetical protein